MNEKSRVVILMIQFTILCSDHSGFILEIIWESVDIKWDYEQHIWKVEDNIFRGHDLK